MKKVIVLFSVSTIFCQTIFTEYLVSGQDTIDVFSYQVPELYDETEPHPLLVAFHQWGGNQNSTYSTTFDEEANLRNWIFMSPFGGSSNNYNHQGAQEMVKNEIMWLMENFNIDKNKIYMVGGSMGGASGMIYSNNHLNPDEPMVAATASGSGILDCERRAIEMDGNNSMNEWFGGDWNQVPFEYHRNSAIYFADFSKSMHYNLQHLPLYFDFGISEPHRLHAEEMYQILDGYNQSMWIDSEPTGSHGFSVMEESHVCDWLSQYSLIDNPDDIHVNLDEPGTAYWLEAVNQIDTLSFINLNANRNENQITINNFNNSDTLVAGILNHNIENYFLSIDTPINKIGLTGSLINGIESIQIQNQEALEVHCSIDTNVIWLSLFGSSLNELPIQGDFIISALYNFIDGDANQDHTLDILDIILMVNHIIEISLLSDFQSAICDIDNDDYVDALDVVLAISLVIS